MERPGFLHYPEGMYHFWNGSQIWPQIYIGIACISIPMKCTLKIVPMITILLAKPSNGPEYRALIFTTILNFKCDFDNKGLKIELL